MSLLLLHFRTNPKLIKLNRCTVPRVKKAIVIILLTAFAHQLTRFFDTSFVPVMVPQNQGFQMGCKFEIADWVHKIDIALYYTTYFTFRILFVFIIPCVALITLNYLLFRALKRAENKRTELLNTKFKLLRGSNHCGLNALEGARESSYAVATTRRHHLEETSGVHQLDTPTVEGRPPAGSNSRSSVRKNRHQEDETLRRTNTKIPAPANAAKQRLLDGQVNGYDDGDTNDEDDGESSCAECAMYEAACAARSQLECQRCSAATDEGGPTATTCGERGELSQAHKPISQCSSLLGGATNTTTNDDMSSWLATQNASSPLCHDEAASIRQDDDNEMDDDNDEQDNTSERASNDSPHSKDLNNDEDEEDDDDLDDREKSAADDTPRPKSGSIDSDRLACGCLMTAKAKAMRRMRLLGKARRGCRGFCHSMDCHAMDKHLVLLDNYQKDSGLQQKAGPRRTQRVKCKATCSSSDPCIHCSNCSGKGAETTDHSEPATRVTMLTSHSDYGNKLGSSSGSKQPAERHLHRHHHHRHRHHNNNSTANNNQLGARRQGDQRDQTNNQDEQPEMFGCGNAIATTTTTTTTTTTLYSANTNSVGSLLQVQNSQGGLKRQGSQVARIKSPSFIGSAGRGSRATLSGAPMSGSAHMPLIVANQTMATTPASVRTMDSNRTTLMLIVVVTVFLMVEVPVAIVTILHVVLNTFDVFKDQDESLNTSLKYIILFTNFFIMISYSVNFTIYCSMSKKFRETFRDIFFCRARGKRKRAQRLMYQNQHSQCNPATQYTQTNNLHALATPSNTNLINSNAFNVTATTTVKPENTTIANSNTNSNNCAPNNHGNNLNNSTSIGGPNRTVNTDFITTTSKLNNTSGLTRLCQYGRANSAASNHNQHQECEL